MTIANWGRALVCAIGLSICGGFAAAQVPLEPAQLPGNTMFYVIWRGLPSTELRKTNSLASLWDDPGLAAMRSSLADTILKSSAQKPAEKQLTRQQLDEYASLLENPFVLGYISNPNKRGYVVSANPSAGKASQYNGFFFVYNRAGKEAILSRAVLAMRGNEKEIPEVSETNIGGVSALKVQRKSGATYWIEDGKYAVSGSDAGVLEEILHRLKGQTASPGSLSESPAYKEAQSILGGGQLELFLRVPDLKSLATGANAGGLQLRPVVDALKLEAIHAVCGRVLLDGPKTRIQGAALGDTATGTLFDIWDQGGTAPPALSFVPADAVTYSDTEISLSGLYDVVKRVTTSLMPPGKEGSVNMVEMMAESKLGMPLKDALAVFSGELGSIQTSPALDNNKQVYFIGIHDKPRLLKLLHTTLTDRIAAERNEGQTTFLKISVGNAKPSTAEAAQAYHVAITSDYAFVGPRLETVRDFVGKRTQKSGSGLAASAGFKTARAQFPATINGLGYFDFSRIDWRAVKAQVIAAAKAAQLDAAKRSAGASKTPVNTATPSWLSDIDPEVFPRHLHVASSASWKDAQGLHFDEWIE